MVHFKDVIKALIKRVLRNKDREFKIKGKLSDKTRSQWYTKFKEIKNDGKKSKNHAE